MQFNVNDIDLGVLVENMPDLIFYLDMDRKLLSFNPGGKRFLKIIGCDNPLPGNDVLQYYPEEKRCHLNRQLDELVKGQVVSFEDSFASGNDIFYFESSIYALTNAEGEQSGFCVLLRDVTEKKRAEEKYRRLFNDNPMVIYVVSLTDFRLLEVNEAAVVQYGYSREELLQKSVLDLRLPEDQEKLANYLYQLRTGEAEGPAGIWRHRLKNGDLIYMQIFLHRIKYTDENAIMAIAQNVTDKILLEKRLDDERNLKQQQLTEAIIGAQETERAQIGRELHDNVNQILGAVRLYLTAAIQEGEPQKVELLKRASSYTLRAIEEIRKLSKNLLSPDLHYIGLENAVLSLAEDIMLVHPITIALCTDGFDEIMLSEKFKLNIFRIIQEQLNNTIKHANANNISICMSKREDEIGITITDDGNGFDTSKKRTGVGLSNIQSRAEFYKGSVEIISTPGNGCQLKLSFPCNETIK